jgi:hypothetical protein
MQLYRNQTVITVALLFIYPNAELFYNSLLILVTHLTMLSASILFGSYDRKFNDCRENSGMGTDEKNRSTKKNLPSSTLSTTNRLWPEVG